MSQDIAIIGMAGRFPEAADLNTFYHNLKTGRDSIREISTARIQATTINCDTSYQVMAYLEDIDRFDHKFFGFSLGEAQHMDPHQRLLLEVAYETLENSGYPVDSFSGSATAVFVGDMMLEYHRHIDDPDPTVLTGSVFNAAAAGQIARRFNLQGPAMMIDTTCSSSLVAVHMACKELRSGEVDYALVCAARLLLFPWEKEDYEDIGINSPDGRAKTFSADANGTGTGEAVACVLLKPLDKALSDQDVIHAVIKGSAVNQDAARSASLTAPSREAQTEVLVKAWENAGIDPRSIAYIEAHGTGTKLGDPIEIDALDAAFKRYTEDKGFCAVSALKTNIGHTDTAAGMSSLIKAILSLKHKEIFPSLHFDRPNPYIDFENAAVYVNNRLSPWPQGKCRYIGVSSFGIIGTNCHVVLGEASDLPSTPDPDPNGEPVLLTVSSKTAEGLRANINRLHQCVQEADRLSLNNLGYTLNCGRNHYEFRHAVIVHHLDDTLHALKKAAARETFASGSDTDSSKTIFLFSGDVTVSEPILDALMTRHPEFRHHFEACREVCPGFDGESRFLRFAFPYSYYKLLAYHGITTTRVIGSGAGKWVIAALMNRSTLAEGLQAAVTADDEPAPVDLQERLQRFVAQEGQTDRLFFFEMGSQGLYSQSLEGLMGSPVPFNLLTLNGPDPFVGLLQTLYLKHYRLDWGQLYRGQKLRKIELPPYCFEKTRCWIKPLGAAPQETTQATDRKVTNWFYDLRWTPEPPLGDPKTIEGKTWLVFMDDHGLGQDLSERLEGLDGRCIKVFQGETFRRREADIYEMNPGLESDYGQLANHVVDTYGNLDGIIHLYQYSHSEPLSSHRVVEELEKGAYSLLALLQAFDHQAMSEGLFLLMGASHAHAVMEHDGSAAPGKAACAGLLRSAATEYPRMTFRALDLDLYPEGDPQPVNQILQELSAPQSLITVAWRDNLRYVPTIVHATADPVEVETPYLKEGGVYLITGGGGGIGLALAEHMVAKARITLILTGRKERSEAPFIALETGGSRIFYRVSDVSDEKSVQELCDWIEAEFGALNGIVHAAVEPGKKRIRNHTRTEFWETIAPKVHGALLLDELATKPLDFFVMFSSQNAILGAERASDYSFANTFLEQFALQKRAQSVPAFTISWSTWSETGMAHRVQGLFGLLDDPERGIRTAEGLRAFDRAMSLNRNVLVTDVNPAILQDNPFYRTDQDGDSGPVSNREAEGERPSSPATQEEIKQFIQELWEDVLKPDYVDEEDDFFNLGGNSLNGAKILTILERELQVQLEFNDIFTHSTLNALANFVFSQTSTTRNQARSAPIERLEPQEDYALSHSQKRLWTLHHIDAASFQYNIFLACRIEGRLNAYALRQACTKLVERHESLRTIFVAKDGIPRQQVLDQTAFDLMETDLSGQPDPEGRARELAEQETVTPFDLARGPLIRLHLLHLGRGASGAEGHLLLCSMHHIIGDAWSLGVLNQEISALYREYDQGITADLPQLEIQYRDYAAWHNASLQDTEAVHHKTFWLDQLSEPLPVIDLPFDFPLPPRLSSHGATLNLTFSKERTAALHRLGATYGASLFMVLATMVKTLLYRYTGQDDVITGTPVAGRPRSELEHQIGFYVNVVALRDRVDSRDSFATLIKRVKQTALDAFSHQTYPFDQIVEELNLERDFSRSPVFDVVVTLENVDQAGPIFEGTTTTDYQLEMKVSRYPLVFYFTEQEDRLEAAVEYNTDLFREDTIKAFSRHLERIIEAVLAAPDMKISDIQLTEQETREPVNLSTQFNF